MKYNNGTQKLINDNTISSYEETAERYSDEQDRNNQFVYKKDGEDVEDEDDDGIDNGSLASKLLNRETCV